MSAFRAAGADPTIGSRLQNILAESGVADVEGLAIAQYLSSDSPVVRPCSRAWSGRWRR